MDDTGVKTKKQKQAIEGKDITSLFETQAISQPDDRQEKTDVALPDTENVVRARNWIIENKK